MNLFRKIVALSVVVLTLALGVAPASANASATVEGDCDREGLVTLALGAEVDAELVQWFVDGQPVGQPTSPFSTLTTPLPGDGQVHLVEYVVLVPEGIDGDRAEVFVPACDTPTTTAPPTTTAQSTAPPTTTAQSTAPPTTTAVSTAPPTTTAPPTSVNPTGGETRTLFVTGIEQDDPDGGLVVRTGPSASNRQIAVLQNGTAVTAVAGSEDGQWTLISAPVEGWVSLRFLTTQTPPTTLVDPPEEQAPPTTLLEVPDEETPPTTLLEVPDEEAPPTTLVEVPDEEAPPTTLVEVPNEETAVDETPDELPFSEEEAEEGGGNLLPILLAVVAVLVAVGAALAVRVKKKGSREDREERERPKATIREIGLSSKAPDSGSGGPVDDTPLSGPTVNSTKSNGGKGSTIILGMEPGAGSGDSGEERIAVEEFDDEPLPDEESIAPEELDEPVDDTPLSGPTVDATKSNGGKGTIILGVEPGAGSGGPVDDTPLSGPTVDATKSNGGDTLVFGTENGCTWCGGAPHAGACSGQAESVSSSGEVPVDDTPLSGPTVTATKSNGGDTLVFGTENGCTWCGNPRHTGACKATQGSS